MGIDKKMKMDIAKSWLTAFPSLSIMSPNKLYKITGCTVIGIELIKSPFKEEYSIYFVVYSLWKNGMNACFEFPVFMERLRNKKGLQFDIPYAKNGLYFDDAAAMLREQAPLSLEGNITLKQILSLIDEHSHKPPLSAAPNSYLQAALQEAKLKIALYISVEDAENVFEQINKRDWDVSHFTACGVGISQWLESLQEAIASREDFLRQIEVNKQDKKLLKMIFSEITL